MKKEEKLKKIIEYAVERGFQNRDWHESFWRNLPKEYFVENWYYEFLFSHDFAEAVFGPRKKVGKDCGTRLHKHKIASPSKYGHYHCECDLDCVSQLAWQYHIQQAVISKDPIQYYYNYVKEK